MGVVSPALPPDSQFPLWAESAAAAGGAAAPLGSWPVALQSAGAVVVLPPKLTVATGLTAPLRTIRIQFPTLA